MKRLKYLLIICVTLVLIFWIYSEIEQSKTEKIRLEQAKIQKENADLILSQLFDKYQPNITWWQDINYTSQLQEKLIGKGPVIFQGLIEDIYIRDNSSYIKLIPFHSFVRENDFDYIAELNCSKEIIEEIKVHNTRYTSYDRWNSNQYYIVFADITDVSKPAVSLIGSYEDEIEMETGGSNLFILKGDCLDILYINEKIIN